MLIDLHAHTKGISHCCRIYAPEVLAAAKEHGMDGICLCNHYQSRYVENGNAAEFARRYMEEFHATRALGREMGVQVFRTDLQGTVVAVSDGNEITFNMSPDESWTAGEPGKNK